MYFPILALSLCYNFIDLIQRCALCYANRLCKFAYYRDCAMPHYVLDIDIIAIDDTVVNTPTLTIPHPLMHKREFVLAPMAELAPRWIHPTLHKSVAELINEL